MDNINSITEEPVTITVNLKDIKRESETAMSCFEYIERLIVKYKIDELGFSFKYGDPVFLISLDNLEVEFMREEELSEYIEDLGIFWERLYDLQNMISKVHPVFYEVHEIARKKSVFDERFQNESQE